MTSVRVCNRHDVEQERINVKVERLVIEEEFGEQAEKLAVIFVSLSVNLPNAEFAFSINFIARRMSPDALCRMSFHADLGFLITQAELAEIKFRKSLNVIGIDALIPDFHVILAHNDPLCAAPTTRKLRQLILDVLAGNRLSIAEQLKIVFGNGAGQFWLILIVP